MIPLPIVVLNRWMLVTSVGIALVLQQPWIIALLFLVLLSAVTLGPRGSVPFQIGTRLLAGRVRAARDQGHVEDRRLMRFNNCIALGLFGLALACFGAGYTVAGWILAAMVLIAAAVALAGFCFGCLLYYHLRLLHLRRNHPT
jgi:hypothetical protein